MSGCVRVRRGVSKGCVRNDRLDAIRIALIAAPSEGLAGPRNGHPEGTRNRHVLRPTAGRAFCCFSSSRRASSRPDHSSTFRPESCRGPAGALEAFGPVLRARAGKESPTMTVDLSDPRDLYGADVTGRHGEKLGKVETVYLDNQTQRPEWAAIKTGLFGIHISLVPLARADYQGGGTSRSPTPRTTSRTRRTTTPDTSCRSRTRSSCSATTASITAVTPPPPAPTTPRPAVRGATEPAVANDARIAASTAARSATTRRAPPPTRR